MTKYDVPPKKELYDHYIDANMTIKWLSKHYFVSERTIREWLKGYGLRKLGRTDLVTRAMYTLLSHGFSGRDVAVLFDTTHTAVFKAKSVYEKQLREGTE